jgi:hypothetical protein
MKAKLCSSAANFLFNVLLTSTEFHESTNDANKTVEHSLIRGIRVKVFSDFGNTITLMQLLLDAALFSP